jgi:hypothetical protein
MGVGMRRLHGEYALLFNRRHRRSGHLFQGGTAPSASATTRNC